MSYTSTSKVICELKKINLMFQLNYHRSDNIRDIFVSLIKRPFRFLTGQKDLLHVIQDLDLKIYEGDKLGLIGVNGTGKTTLCRVISGMYSPSDGEVLLGEHEVRAIFDSGVGIMPELTGRENAYLLARFIFQKANKKEIDNIISDAVEFSELGHFIDVPIKTYSKGMQARLCLSLISARPCDLLILDEVFDGADLFFQEKISKRVLKMIDESGAVIFVSHSTDQIEKACNRLVILDKGNIAYDGPVDKGMKFYQNIHS